MGLAIEMEVEEVHFQKTTGNKQNLHLILIFLIFEDFGSLHDTIC